MTQTCTVRGSWPFPLDMLRHDGVEAATAEDQALIDRLSAEHATDREDFQPVEIKLTAPGHPLNAARWASFDWEVIADPHKHARINWPVEPEQTPNPAYSPAAEMTAAQLLAFAIEKGLTQAAAIDAFANQSADEPNADAYIDKAREGTDDELEIDDNPMLSVGDGGAWVSAWVWVSDEEAGIGDEDDADEEAEEG